jgi:hypothetical protein
VNVRSLGRIEVSVHGTRTVRTAIARTEPWWGRTVFATLLSPMDTRCVWSFQCAESFTDGEGGFKHGEQSPLSWGEGQKKKTAQRAIFADQLLFSCVSRAIVEGKNLINMATFTPLSISSACTDSV